MRAKEEVFPIGKTNPDWNRIKAEYVSGTDSLRMLSEKHSVPFSTIRRRSEREGWAEARKQARIKIEQNVVKESAKKTADNATLAADIRRKGLILLDGLFDDFAEVRATEHRESRRGVTDIKRLRDLTAAYKDLTDDMAKPEETENPLLRSLWNVMQEKRNE